MTLELIRVVFRLLTGWAFVQTLLDVVAAALLFLFHTLLDASAGAPSAASASDELFRVAVQMMVQVFLVRHSVLTYLGAVLLLQALVLRLSEEARLRMQLQVRVIESLDCWR